MNLLLVISDSMRRDHLSCYGGPVASTPSLDRLAGESVVFDRAYACSYPTLPCRAEMFTGRFVFPYLSWGPLPRDEVLLSETLAAAGYTCTMVTDNLPLCAPRHGYHRGFHSRIRVRGQWHDNFQPPTREFTWPCAPEKLGAVKDGRIQQYLRNVSIREREEDYFAPQVTREAIHWLEQHGRRGPFFLYVDLFDPHEPWDPPAADAAVHDVQGTGEDVVYPRYGPASVYPPEDLRRIRALYAGEVRLVDRWLGRLLDAVDVLGLREETVVAFLSDHGVFLGERDLLGKLSRHADRIHGWPPYPEAARIPLMLRVPGCAPRRTPALAHPGDLAPTLLELAGVEVPGSMTAASLVPILHGRAEAVRDTAVSSWSLAGWSPYQPSVVRSDEWSLVYWRAGIEPELYHLLTDPGERCNVYAEHRQVAREMHGRYLRFLERNETPWRHILPRRWLVSRGGPHPGALR